MDANLEKAHAALKSKVQRFHAQASTVIMAMGLVQEALGVNAALMAHCDALKTALDTKNEALNQDGGSIQGQAPGSASGEDRG